MKAAGNFIFKFSPKARRNKSIINYWLVVSVLIIFCFVGLSAIARAADVSLQNMLDTLSEIRVKCYEDTRQLKNAYEKSDDRYKAAERLYKNVKIKSDVLIDRIRSRLIAGNNLSDATLLESIENLNIASKEYNNYIDSIFSGTNKSSNTVGLVIDSLIKIFDTFEKHSSAEKEKIIAELERMRFYDFNKI